MLAETSSKVLSFSGLIHGICMSFNWNRMCVSFQYYFLKERLKAKVFVILLVLWRGRVRVARPVPAVCHFCATFIFQEIKETAKDKHSFVNTTLAFALPPRKIQKGAKQVKGDNGLLVTTYTSTCQEHSKLSSCCSIAAARDHLLNQEQLFRNTPASPSPAQHKHTRTHTHICLAQIGFGQKTVPMPAGCPCQWRWWSGMQSQCYTFPVFAWSLRTHRLLSCPAAWWGQGHQEMVLGANSPEETQWRLVV